MAINETNTQQAAGDDPSDQSGTRVVGFRDALPLLRPYQKQLISAFIVGLTGTIAAAGQPLVVSRIVDAFSGSFPIALAIIMVALLLLSAAATAIRQLIMQRAGERFAFDTRERVIRRIYALPMARLEKRDRADLVSRISTDVSQIREILTSGLVEIASTGVTVVVSVVMMAFIDPVLLGLAAVAVCIVIVAILLIGRTTRPAGLRLQEAVGELAGAVSRSLGSMKTIRAARSVTREADVSVSYAEKALEAGLSVAGLRAVVQAFSGISVQVLLIVVIGAGALRVASGSITTGELSAFIMYLMLMVAPMTLFGGLMSMLGEAFGALSRVLEIEAEEPERDVQVPSLSEDAGRRAEPGVVFRLENVSFEYPGDHSEAQGEAALRNLSLAIQEGRTTAIVGPSGAGKSTLFALIERFYEPTSGRILYRGADVTGISRDGLRSQIAYVDQDSAVLSGTVRDNLILAAPSASEEKCAHALCQVGLASTDEDARRFLAQEVGESGSKLSGGERQRLAIARAIVAETPILLLDEITSNLDSRNEALIHEVLLPASNERTVLVIAHRLSTVVSADTIVLLEDGRVVAQGTHRELLSESPLYKELAERQFVSEYVGT